MAKATPSPGRVLFDIAYKRSVAILLRSNTWRNLHPLPIPLLQSRQLLFAGVLLKNLATPHLEAHRFLHVSGDAMRFSKDQRW